MRALVDCEVRIRLSTLDQCTKEDAFYSDYITEELGLKLKWTGCNGLRITV
jgi:hypothetical protein